MKVFVVTKLTLLVALIVSPEKIALDVMLRLADALTVPPRNPVPAAIVLAANVPHNCELPDTLAPVVELLAVSAYTVSVSAIKLVTPTHVANESVDIITFAVGLAS